MTCFTISDSMHLDNEKTKNPAVDTAKKPIAEIDSRLVTTQPYSVPQLIEDIARISRETRLCFDVKIEQSYFARQIDTQSTGLLQGSIDQHLIVMLSELIAKAIHNERSAQRSSARLQVGDVVITMTCNERKPAYRQGAKDNLYRILSQTSEHSSPSVNVVA